MLFEFHQKQNAKKPGAVHATYLLTGRKAAPPSYQNTNGNGAHKDGEDTIMPSSPFMSSFTKGEEPMEEDAHTRLTITVATEEKLEGEASYNALGDETLLTRSSSGEGTIRRTFVSSDLQFGTRARLR